MNARAFLSVWRPWLFFFTIGRPFSGMACALLQMTGIGWPISVIWAMNAHDEYEAEQKAEKARGDGFNEYPTAGESKVKDGSHVEDTKPAKSTLTGKVMFAFLGVIIVFALSMAVVTYKPDVNSKQNIEETIGEQYLEILVPAWAVLYH